MNRRKNCSQIGCSKAKYGEKCEYKNCEYHPKYNFNYRTENLCNHPKSWWLCSNCGSEGCQRCFAFKCPTVNFCVNCYREWLEKNSIFNKEDFIKKVKHYVEIGDILWNKVMEVIRENKNLIWKGLRVV